jgi:hypothetical protein
VEWAILEELKGEEAKRVPLLLRLDEVWGVSLHGLPLLLSLFDEVELEAVEPEAEEITDEEVSPILPRGGRARSGAGKCTLLIW